MLVICILNYLVLLILGIGLALFMLIMVAMHGMIISTIIEWLKYLRLPMNILSVYMIRKTSMIKTWIFGYLNK